MEWYLYGVVLCKVRDAHSYSVWDPRYFLTRRVRSSSISLRQNDV